jgi:hypothetical protein
MLRTMAFDPGQPLLLVVERDEEERLRGDDLRTVE